MKCPHCGNDLTPEDIARLMGSIKTEAKAKASRENGAKGGRPRGSLTRYRVDVENEGSMKFWSKQEAGTWARGYDPVATIYEYDAERDDWQLIGTKPRYAKRVTWQEGFLSRPQA